MSHDHADVSFASHVHMIVIKHGWKLFLTSYFLSLILLTVNTGRTNFRNDRPSHKTYIRVKIAQLVKFKVKFLFNLTRFFKNKCVGDHRPRVTSAYENFAFLYSIISSNNLFPTDNFENN